MIILDHCQRPRLVLIRRRWQLVTLELLRTPSLRSSVCPVRPVLRAKPVSGQIQVGIISVLCMAGYEPSILYIRQSAVEDRGYA